MKPRKVIIQIEMLTDAKIKNLKRWFKEVLKMEDVGSDIEVRANVIRDTKK